jgi:hypothetical protein
MPTKETKLGQGELCDGKYYLTIKYDKKKYGLWDKYVCPPRQWRNNYSSWDANTCCDLNACPFVSGASAAYMDRAMKVSIGQGKVISPNVVLVE